MSNTKENGFTKALKPYEMSGLKRLHEKLSLTIDPNWKTSCFEGLFSLNFEIFEEDMNKDLMIPVVREVDDRRPAIINLWSNDEHLFEGHFEDVGLFRKNSILSEKDRKATFYIMFSRGNIDVEPFVLLLELSPVRNHGTFGRFIGQLMPY